MNRTFSLLILFIVLCAPAAAIESRTGMTVTVGEQEVLDDSLLARGDTVRIEGTVTGNVIAFANRIVVTGTVQGSLIAFSRSLDVRGRVQGNVFSFSQQADFRGQVAASITSFAQQVAIDRQARIDADAILFAAESRVDGTVARDLTAFAGRLDVAGDVGRNLVARSDGIHVASGARVGGDLRAVVDDREKVQIAPGATIAGRTDIDVRVRPARYAQPGFYFWLVVRLLAAFVTGLVLFALFPTLFGGQPRRGTALLRTAGVGFIALVVTPIAAVLLAITLIGLPVGALLLVAWLAGIYVAKILVGAMVGLALLKRQSLVRVADLAVPLLLGLLLVFVAISLPYIGSLIHFVFIIVGLGLAISQVHARWRSQPAAAPQATA